jgi:PAS domain S-box-containing protein
MKPPRRTKKSPEPGQWSQPVSPDALRQSEAKFRGLLEAAPDAIVIVDREGAITLANRQAAIMFGYAQNELAGRRIESLIPHRFRDMHGAHRQGYNCAPKVRPMGAGLELYALHKDGREIPVEISLSPVQLGDDFMVTAAIRDISERRHAEKELRKLHQLQLAQAEHLATLGEVAAGLAHEIKNPLAGIAAALEILAREFPSGTTQQEVMGDVQKQVERIKITLDELLNYARPRPLQPVNGDLNETVQGVVQFASQTAAGHRVDIQFRRGELEPVLHDVEYIQRLVLNLLLNAIDAVDHDGRIEVETSYDGVTRSEAQIHVRDNGPGIAAENLERIFRPFYTTKGPRGTGLGLSMCRRIAELHSGSIALRSQPGVGSTFTVTLPAAGALADDDTEGRGASR